MQLLRSAADGGAGVVVVLNDLTMATRFFDRIILLAEGRILLDGEPAMLTDELIASAYGVAALRGEHAGQPFILPWAPVREATMIQSSFGGAP